MLVAGGSFGSEPGPRVLDLYAGSGALAFEALSRGAVSAVLVESARPALVAIRENVAALGVDERVRVVASKVERALDQLDSLFDLVLVDPPYVEVRAPGFASILEKVASLLAPGGVLVLEHASNDEPAAPRAVTLDRRRRHGDTTLSLFRANDPDEPDLDGPDPGEEGAPEGSDE